MNASTCLGFIGASYPAYSIPSWPGFVPAIHVFDLANGKHGIITGTSPAMTTEM